MKKDTGLKFHRDAIRRLKQKQEGFEPDSPRWLELEREIRLHDAKVGRLEEPARRAEPVVRSASLKITGGPLWNRGRG